MQSVQVIARAFWLPKAGHGTEEYEDAFSLPEEPLLPLRAAVADGATESAFAREWAAELAVRFAAEGLPPEGGLEARLPVWRAAWQARVADRVQDLPWYAAAKAEQGAFAAFLGLRLQPEAQWQAVAVGDCCLFQLCGAEVCRCWPLSRPEDFHNRPALLCSRPGRTVPDVQTCAGTWRGGDTFLLATDALAAWLMRTGAAAARSFTAETFARCVAEARAAGTMRNDDVTLVMLALEPAH